MKSARRVVLFTLYSSLFTAVACRISLSPVKNRVAVGVESYVVFDADGEAGQGDLYVGSASGGSAFRITFTRVHESSPALSPDGVMLAFIRGSQAADSAGHRIWIMNLLNGAEREVPELGAGSYPNRLAWSLDGTSLYARTSRGDFRIPAPPSRASPEAITPASKAYADTLFSAPLGEPVIGLALPCERSGVSEEGGICAWTASGSQPLSPEGRNAFRWGTDSVAYLRAARIEVRPLGGGSVRQLIWTQAPANIRTATHFPGAGQTDPGL